ncbi:MAG TPA: hypothetical protein VN249_10355 [Prolixibacteraceae bacterium]|nr:hypothetical protein [Prolixibacteraceae bacterium]
MSRKQLILKWLNIFLLIINISAFVSFLLMNRQNGSERDQKFSSDQFLQTELGLTPEQFRKVSELNIDVFRLYQVFLDKKCELNFQLVDELASEKPADAKMDSLSTRIGQLDAALKKQTVRHFKNVKSVCTEEQKILLDQLLKEMLDAGEQCKFCNKIDCARRDRLNNQ